MASNHEEIRNTIETTLTEFIDAYKDGATQNDASIINRNVTPQCTRHLLPVSLLQSFGLPPDHIVDNEEYEKQFEKDLKVGQVDRCVISNVVIDVAARKAAASTVADMVCKDGETIVMEHSWFLDFSTDGSKITKVVEFCDQNAVHKLMEKVRAGNA